MAEEQGSRPGTTRDAAGAVEPGTVSRLLVEVARASEETVAASWREALGSGDVVGRYAIRREVGRGGFGAVYEAFDPQLGRVVALKALRPGKNRRLLSEEWIQKEAEAVAKLDHPAIVTIHDVGTCPAGAYLVMELLQGETLADRIARGPLPVDEALRVAEQMAEGLAHAHSRGVLHRDLKPANVFLCADGRVKLLDFGLAHLLGTDGSSGAGTPAYMAPEQAAGADVDERADVYAAAMVLGEMLTGRRPVEPATPRGPSPRPPSSQTERMWEEQPAPAAPAPPSTAAPNLDGVPRPAARAVKAGLSVNPEARPKDGGAWLAELRSVRLQMERPRRTRRVAALTAAGIAIGLALAGFATWRLWERQIPGGRVTVAVADFVNETGEKELDGLSGLLTTSLEQSSALRVLTRSRMFDVLKQLGKADAQRIDEPLAREVGKHSGVRALLLASVRKAGDGYVVEMRALDPLLDEYVFTLRDRAPRRSDVLELIDRLGTATRERLGVASRDVTPAPKIASITTTNLKAYDLLFQSRRALDLARFEEAYRLAEAALAEDPDSALARFQMYVVTDWRRPVGGWDKAAALRERREAAEKTAGRLPEKERLRLQLEVAALEQQYPEVDRLCERMTAAYPLDKEILLDCGTIRFHLYYAERDRTLGYIERALQLDPTYELAVIKLCMVLQTLGGAEERLEFLRQRARVATEDALLDPLAGALLAARAEPEATALLERLQTRRGRPFPSPRLAVYQGHTGRPAEAERMLRACLAAVDALPEAERERTREGCTLALTEPLSAQGKRREALEALGTLRDLPRLESAVIRMYLHAAAGATDRVREAAREFASPGDSVDPEVERWAASVLVESGLLRDAAPLYARAKESIAWERLPHSDRVYADALAALSAGAPDGEARVRELAASGPHLGGRSLASHVLARLLRDQGKCGELVGVLEGSMALPPSVVVEGRGQRLPLQLHWLAECHEKLGDVARARERNEELLRLWVNADPDLPLLAEAKAMQARLAVAAPPPR